MLRRLSTTFLAAFSIAVTMIALWPCLDFYWCLTPVIASTPQAPDPTMISAPIARISLASLSYLGYDDHAAIVQAIVAPLLAICIYRLITGWSGAGVPQTFCRRCKGILRGLTSPQCPACGEPL